MVKSAPKYLVATKSSGSSRIAAVVSRAPLVMMTVIFSLIGFKYLSNPVGAAAAVGINFTSPGGVTIGRVGFAGFPLSFAILAFTSLVSARRRLYGLYMVSTVVSVVMAIRIFGMLAVHSTESARLLAPEAVLLILSLVAIRLEPGAVPSASTASEMTLDRGDQTTNDTKALSSSNGSVKLTALPRRKWLPEAQWSFPTFSMEYNRAKIAFTDVGNGPVLLFVHTGMWSFIWRDVITLLSPTFRCICFDAPGTGQTVSPPRSKVNLTNVAQVTRAIIEELDLQDLTLIVHDLGGPSGLAGASYLAERIRGIVAINAFAWKPSGAAFRGMLGLMGSSVMREFDVLTNLVPRITATSFGVGRHLNEESRRAFLGGIKQHTPRSFHYYMDSARNSEDLYARVEAALLGPFHNLPLLTIFGERNDPLGFQPCWKRLFAGAQQVVVARGNHFPMCDDPRLVARSIRTWHGEQVLPYLSTPGYSDAQ